ncbi:hypothetical protein M0802_005427 [Mischocyttarus mexicanus]|nr:hypothetical protein M0802_005427 [Mischocyttarus mexicanus]
MDIRGYSTGSYLSEEKEEEEAYLLQTYKLCSHKISTSVLTRLRMTSANVTLRLDCLQLLAFRKSHSVWRNCQLKEIPQEPARRVKLRLARAGIEIENVV